MIPPLTLWILGDGKPGHENQSLGLAEAMARRAPCQIHRISLAGQRGIIRRVRAAVRACAGLPKPDIIIAAGHATHLALLFLACKTGARSVVLMRPSLPMGLFKACIVPGHDFKKPPTRPNLILTQGALNRVTPPSQTARQGRIILIGGPSRSHGWAAENLLAQLADILQDGSFQLTDSRRTPEGFTREIAKLSPALEIFPHSQTPPDWLPAKLASAEEIWVTEDSVSMIYEALSSGARVGLLAVPRTGQASRVLRGLERLVAEGYLTPYSEWQSTRRLKPAPTTLREADRCAEEIARKFHF